MTRLVLMDLIYTQAHRDTGQVIFLSMDKSLVNYDQSFFLKSLTFNLELLSLSHSCS